MRKLTCSLSVIALLAACSKGRDAARADTLGAHGSAMTDSGMHADTGMNADPDRAMSGSGVPSGYTATTDKATAAITDAKYSASGGRWEVQTGPAHIVFSPKDSASGIYGVSTTIEQLEQPRHPEGYGIIFGGQHLDDRAKQKYGYFLVRGTGEYLVKMRDGDHTTSVIDWTASPDVPKQDASGKATYKLLVHAAQDTVHFAVNGKVVAAVPKSRLSTDGIAGLRINHNLHVAVTPVEISK